MVGASRALGDSSCKTVLAVLDSGKTSGASIGSGVGAFHAVSEHSSWRTLEDMECLGLECAACLLLTIHIDSAAETRMTAVTVLHVLSA